MITGLFINSPKAQCSIHESGNMIYSALRLSKKFDLQYIEISEEDRSIPTGFDFFVFNYHPNTMHWMDPACIRRLPGIKITFVLEVAPWDPFVMCPKVFDAYCALDPTMRHSDKRVYAFPRPLEEFKPVVSCDDCGIPVIGSFGFNTPGKGFEKVVDAVNDEFERAFIRMHIPDGSFVTPKLTAGVKESCIKRAEPGIRVFITDGYMSKSDLITWCSQHTINVFLYDRNQPGLSATTDQAISSGRPLAVSVNETFRHIHRYLTPYPYASFQESIESSSIAVKCMKHDWTKEKFMKKFEGVLDDFGVEERIRVNGTFTFDKMGTVGRGLEYFVGRLPSIFARHPYTPKMTYSPDGAKILIVSHKEKQCGIHQYGLDIASALAKSNKHRFSYCECSDEWEYSDAIMKHDPDVVIFNYYPITMPWLTPKVTSQWKRFATMGIMHEVTQREAMNASRKLFHYHLCPDPTLIESALPNCVFKTPRLIPQYINREKLPVVPTIGSFGFGFEDKGFVRLVRTVQDEFDNAVIRLHLPFNDLVDRDGKEHAIITAVKCRAVGYKHGVDIRVSHDFLTKRGLLDFLAGNTLNAFFYDVNKYKGISSTIECALAVCRPIAITRCGMFRHVWNAPICIEEHSLKEIIKAGTSPLESFYSEWNERTFIKRYEEIMDTVLN